MQIIKDILHILEIYSIELFPSNKYFLLCTTQNSNKIVFRITVFMRKGTMKLKQVELTWYLSA